MRRFLRGSSGQGLVEISLVGLIFIAIVLGVIEGGRAVWNYNTLAQAAREGARYAVVHGSKSSDPSGPGSTHFTSPDQDAMVDEIVRRFASGLDDDNVEVTAEWLDGTNQRGGRVRVTVRYQFDSVVGYFGLPAVPMTSSTVMTITY
jgi:Flp pilus assembly protein TadG